MNDWIKWEGGDRPVGEQTRVKLILRNGDEIKCMAGLLSWAHNNKPIDIMKYRIL